MYKKHLQKLGRVYRPSGKTIFNYVRFSKDKQIRAT
jgi:hypothetical protein